MWRVKGDSLAPRHHRLSGRRPVGVRVEGRTAAIRPRQHPSIIWSIILCHVCKVVLLKIGEGVIILAKGGAACEYLLVENVHGLLPVGGRCVGEVVRCPHAKAAALRRTPICLEKLGREPLEKVDVLSCFSCGPILHSTREHHRQVWGLVLLLKRRHAELMASVHQISNAASLVWNRRQVR